MTHRFQECQASSRCARFAVFALAFGAVVGTVVSAGRSFASEGGLIDDVEGFHFVIPDLEAAPGDVVRTEFQGLHETGVQGFQLVVEYSVDAFEIHEIHSRDTILDAIETDFIDVNIDRDDGFFVVGVLVDTRPPFEGQVIPNIGQPLPLVYVDGQVRANATEHVVFQLTNGLSTPPLSNIFVVENESIPVTELSRGLILVDGVERPVPAFLRGDANSDSVLDMTDAIGILAYRFLGGPAPTCMDAADINDDEFVDMADSVFLLGYLFNGTAAPPAPMPSVGHDPTPGQLGCEEPVDYVLAVP